MLFNYSYPFSVLVSFLLFFKSIDLPEKPWILLVSLQLCFPLNFDLH